MLYFLLFEIIDCFVYNFYQMVWWCPSETLAPTMLKINYCKLPAGHNTVLYGQLVNDLHSTFVCLQ